jgi:hypothetical protein
MGRCTVLDRITQSSNGYLGNKKPYCLGVGWENSKLRKAILQRTTGTRQKLNPKCDVDRKDT